MNNGQNASEERIVRLGTSGDFEVADGDIDPRGWPVVAGDGQHIGRVNDLIADTADMTVSHFDITLEDRAEGASHSRNVLVPARVAILDDRERRVVLPAVPRSTLRALPAFEGRALPSGYDDPFASTTPVEPVRHTRLRKGGSRHG